MVLEEGSEVGNPTVDCELLLEGTSDPYEPGWLVTEDVRTLENGTDESMLPLGVVGEGGMLDDGGEISALLFVVSWV